MFRKAIVRLTATYLSIIMVISIFFSINIYFLATHELDRGYGRRNAIITNPQQDLPYNFREQLIESTERIAQEAKTRVAISLFFTNIGVLLVGGWVSYVLARRSLEPIEEAHAALERFTADASHELRTPIAAMKSEIEVALMQPTIKSTEAKELLQSNLEELDVLTRLSENLLKIARLDNKDLTLKRQPINPLVTQAIDRLLPLAEKKNILLQNLVDDKLTASVDGDSIIEAVIIVLDNAIKYSPQKTQVTVSSKSRERTRYIIIEDQGMGIDKKDLPHIFERFYQADTARSKQTRTGHGLGLAIAKQIIHHNNGTIRATSKQGSGSRFTIQLHN